MLDWTSCTAVERLPDKLSGACLFRGTRVQVKTVFENLEDGATVDQFLERFPAFRGSKPWLSWNLRKRASRPLDQMGAFSSIKERRCRCEIIYRDLMSSPRSRQVGLSCRTANCSRKQEEHFDVLVTTDKQLRYQQNLAGRSIAVVVLPHASWLELEPYAEKIAAAVLATQPGSYVELELK